LHTTFDVWPKGGDTKDNPSGPSYVVAVNVARRPCLGCRQTHRFISRQCHPVAYPVGFSPVGLPVLPARAPAVVWPDLEAQALRHRLAIATEERLVRSTGGRRVL
jgi:hypothetical protein